MFGESTVGNVGARGDVMHVWMIVGCVVVVGIVVVTIAMLPDIVRYMKIKSLHENQIDVGKFGL
jgi:membrane protein YdbS with pleckstrin-like domain